MFNQIAEDGTLSILIAAGARILESACGPCIGMGQSPNSKGISLRTFNRNFLGRSGTKDAQIYLVSPETAAISAITGVFTDPRTCGEMPAYVMPEKFIINDIESGVTLKVGDNITTDHIMPAGAKILPLRSNIPAISEYCFTVCDETFPKRAKEAGTSIIVGGTNYGQGSSREHAALAPLYLGVKAIICKSFARIHRQNLINNGILPLEFVNEADYDRIEQGDDLVIANIRNIVENGGKIIVEDKTKGFSFEVKCELSERGKGMMLAGGLLNYTKANG